MRVLLAPAFSIAVFAISMFLVAGRWDWWQGWATIILIGIVTGLDALKTAKVAPELMKHRGQLGKGTIRLDFYLLMAFSVALLAMFIVAALDSGRLGGAVLPWPWFIVGAVLFTLGQTIVGRAMRENTFFEKTVRLQTDRDHKVITTGPYALVRHPGYTGFLIGYALGFPLMMTSGWALVPGALTIATLVVRTVFEDRFLNENLAGYKAYAQEVKFKLLPGIW